jgi:cation:H+ antiporter
MLLAGLAAIVGLTVLIWGAREFVLGASSTASNLDVSPLVIGLTVVGFGTSSPEIFVSAIAVWQGNPGLSIGNAIGSNIANIGLVIGATALLTPLTVRSQTLKREFMVLFAVTIGVWVLLADTWLGRGEGIMLLSGLCIVMTLMVRLALAAPARLDPLEQEYAHEIPTRLTITQSLFRLGVGLFLLLLGSRVVVWGVTEIALGLGVSDLVIGLTVVAVGTSLPELATSVASVVKGEPDIAIGNLIGSNMFNLLAVLPIPALVAPGALPAPVLDRDYPVMVALSIALFAMAYGFRKPGRISRFEGAVLLVGFCAYQFVLYVSPQ